MLELITIIFAIVMNFLAGIIIFVDVLNKEADKEWLIPSFLFFSSAICWTINLITINT